MTQINKWINQSINQLMVKYSSINGIDIYMHLFHGWQDTVVNTWFKPILCTYKVHRKGLGGVLSDITLSTVSWYVLCLNIAELFHNTDCISAHS